MSVQKPSRYIDSELNAVHKIAAVRVALAFPDIYDIGMSHLGLRILYEIINKLPYASAERVFSPWIDLEEAMNRNGVLLSSLESGLPLKDFDVVGFSLQYELSYTTVLNMMHLGGIPVRSADRLEEEGIPFVIAGGPSTLNPSPMSPFIDAFFIGDAEEAAGEILDAVHSWKKSGSRDKTALLKSFAEIAGMYVPLFAEGKKVTRRIIGSLDDAPFPEKPILPFTGIIHDRVNIEIARGCSMGCRFCQAGMAYRPVRERSPEKVLALAETCLAHTGYEDVSFTSLSSGDYSCLHLLMREFNRKFGGKRISMSLPSLRVGSVNSGILREIRAVRKTGFTIAPEAGTDRLRSVINKDFTEETYLRAIETLFSEGWHNLKLYFMTGLPTETEDDIAAIPEMVLRAIRISKKLTGRHVNISVGVSSFVPKPHTPFQWYGQDPLETLKEKNGFLKKALLRRGVKYKGHAEEMSLLEAVLSRGDESVSRLIEAAWAEGCRLDAWTEVFDFEKWKKAMDASGVDGTAVARRTYALDADLPWDNIRTGVTKEYLVREYRNALSGSFTSDCRKRCQGCGLKCRNESEAEETGRRDGIATGATERPALPDRGARIGPSTRPETGVTVRLQYSKTGKTRYLSHLELMTAIMRAMRRADFPLRYSAGFHPSPRASFGPALGVGIAGLKEFLDIELTPPFDTERGLRALNETLPDGIRVATMAPLGGREKSLNSFIVRYIYEIQAEAALDEKGFSERDEVIIDRKGTPVNIRKMVEDITRLDEKTFRLTLCDIGEIKVRVTELMPAIFGLQAGELDIARVAMFGWDGEWVEPLEGKRRIWAAKS